MTEGERRCPRCGLVKELSEFGSDPNKPLGRDSRCKRCINDGVQISQRKVKADLRTSQAAYRRATQRLRAAHASEFAKYLREERS